MVVRCAGWCRAGVGAKPGRWVLWFAAVSLVSLTAAALALGQSATAPADETGTGATEPGEAAGAATQPAGTQQAGRASESRYVGRRVVVTLTSGQQLEGELVARTPEQVVLRIATVRTPIELQDVASVAPVRPIEARYRERRKELESGDLQARQRLVQWLIQEQAYQLALAELATLRRLYPDNQQLKLLERIANQQIELAKQRAAERKAAQEAEARESDTNADAATGERRSSARREDHRLSEAQINRIRVWEVDPETEPRVDVPLGTLKQLFAKYGDHDAMPKGPNALQKVRFAPDWKKLQLLFRVRARDLYHQVRVLEDPEPIGRFRRSVHQRYVLGFCATAGCHGSRDDNGLYLFQRARRTNQTVYSNFYLLSQYENEQGRMIDREAPGQSLLVQYGLPRELADIPHPKVNNWRPFFRSRDNEQYQAMLDIIGSLYKKPQYGIDYQPPAKSPAQPEANGDGPDRPPKR